MAVGEELASGGDELIGRFVAEAREAGCSWTEIGERMGVSKQAARQRFTQQPATPAVAGLGPGDRLRPEDRLECFISPGRQRRRRRGKAVAGACSFCGKPGGAQLRLVAGPGVFICAECVGLCTKILGDVSPGTAGAVGPLA